MSATSVWEIEIKRATGRLDAPEDLLRQLDDADFTALGISLEHAYVAGSLPLHHRDPFDRMLVAQAQLEGLTLITDDQRITPYAVHTMPASSP